MKITSYPKVGIRPTIDGREKGVRESLEDQTMQMANNVKKYIEDNLKYPDGTPIKCVIAPTTIGGIAQASNCEKLFQKENVEVSLTVTRCWCYGSETMDMHPTRPKAILGFNGTERPGAVYLAAVLSAHNQMGLPAFGIYGEQVQDADDFRLAKDVKRKIKMFIQSGIAVALMKNRSYLSIGSVSMGIAGSNVNQNLFQKYFGMRNEYVDMSEIIRRLENKIYDEKEYQIALAWIKENASEGEDFNLPQNKMNEEEKAKLWETITKITLITKDLMEGNEKLQDIGYNEESLGHDAIVAGFQGQRHWTDFMPNADFTEAILNSSFDWNGIRAPKLIATENDSLNGLSMLLGYLMSNSAQIFCDVRTYWSLESLQRVAEGNKIPIEAKNGVLHLTNSGSASLDGSGKQTINGQPAMKPFWEITKEEAQACLDSTKWCPANFQYFRGGGYSSQYISEGNMPLTMSRLSYIAGVGPVLQIIEGTSITFDSNLHNILSKRTDPAWPTTWFVPRLDEKNNINSVYEVMNNWGANHCVLSYGHIGADLITLASQLRIPVSMHNIAKELIFRPAIWTHYGNTDLQGADYRACEKLGPLY